MVGLIIYWDTNPDLVAVNRGVKRWLSTYLFSAEAFKVDNLFVIGTPGIKHGYNIQHKEYQNLESLLNEYPKVKLAVCIGDNNDDIKPVGLYNYKHPNDNVLYMVGRDYDDIEYDKIKDRDVDYITIGNPGNINHLWSNVVAGIVLRDRYVKLWQ